MIELLKTECFSISTFKVGETITRAEEAKIYTDVYNEATLLIDSVYKYSDRSYLGEPFKFLGIHNNQIWLERTKKGFFGNEPVKLPLDQWREGWQKYETPKGY